MKFVTMADQHYLPGAKRLIESIELNSGFKNHELEFIILNIGDSSLSKIEIDVASDVEIIDANKFEQFEFDESLLTNPERTTQQNKFLIFKLPYDEVMCYVDADQLCLGDITELKSFDPITAAADFGHTYPSTIKNYPMFNSGMFVFRPSAGLYENIQSFALDYDKTTGYGDQAILNEFIYSTDDMNLDLLGPEWNTTISIKRYHPRLWWYVKKQGIKFLHYTRCKPWNSPKNLKEKMERLVWYRNEINLWENL